MTNIKFLSGLLDSNPIENLLPVNTKFNHGVKLCDWIKVLKKRGVGFEQAIKNNQLTISLIR